MSNITNDIQTIQQTNHIFFNINTILDETALIKSCEYLDKNTSNQVNSSLVELNEESKHSTTTTASNTSIEKYSRSIKPNIDSFHLIEYLSKNRNKNQVYFYSSNKILIEQLSELLKSNSQVSEWPIYSGFEQAFASATVSNNFRSDNDNILVFDNNLNLNHVKDEILVRNLQGVENFKLVFKTGENLEEIPWKKFTNCNQYIIQKIQDIHLIDFVKGQFADLQWHPEEFQIDCDTKPTNTELKYWSTIVPIKNLYLPSEVIVRGRQVGRTIGIPTANLSYPEDFIIKYGLCPGVYYGKCTLTQDKDMESSKSIEDILMMQKMKTYLNKEIDCVMSFGPNRQYNQKNITYEILFQSKFPCDFYGLRAAPIISGFVRPMAKFPSFDSFIKAMWNDIHISKMMLKLAPKL